MKEKNVREIPRGILHIPHIILFSFFLFTMNIYWYLVCDWKIKIFPVSLVKYWIGFNKIVIHYSICFLLIFYCDNFFQPKLVIGTKTSSSRHSGLPGVLNSAGLSSPCFRYKVWVLKWDKETFLLKIKEVK